MEVIVLKDEERVAIAVPPRTPTSLLLEESAKFFGILPEKYRIVFLQHEEGMPAVYRLHPLLDTIPLPGN